MCVGTLIFNPFISMPKEKAYTTRIPKSIHTIIKLHCARQNIPFADYIAIVLRNHIDGNPEFQKYINL